MKCTKILQYLYSVHCRGAANILHGSVSWKGKYHCNVHCKDTAGGTVYTASGSGIAVYPAKTLQAGVYTASGSGTDTKLQNLKQDGIPRIFIPCICFVE